MTEYRVEWQQCPYIRHDKNVLFVEANSAADAKAIVKDYVERKLGIEWFGIGEPAQTKPVPPGKVLL